MSVVNILKSIGDFLSKLAPWAKKSIATGTAVANEIKTIIDNPAWDVATSLTSTKLDDIALAILRQFIAKVLVDLKLASGVTSEVDLSIGISYKEASQAINSMQTSIAKAGTLNTIAAAVNVKYAELTGNVMPNDTAIAAGQSAYKHPELLA